jgi:transglutaminase-like putative cysteine protease/tetratricopeptide (TPR) repeat protein
MLRWPSVLVSLCLCLFPLNSNGSDEAGAWQLPRFSVEGAELNKAAASVPVKPGTDIVVLDQETNYVFDADGKSVRTEYLVYKVLTQNGAEGWDAISVGWEPWHAERPTVRARVITPDNAVHPLDAKTVSDAPAVDEEEKTYGNGRVLRAPLPAIGVGSLVEEEEVLRENASFFGAGIVAADYFGGNAPVEHTKLVLDAPASLPLRYTTSLLPDVKVQKSETNGRTQIVFEQGPMEALEESEPYLPADIPSRPVVRFSTGMSWQNIAEGYGKIVDEKANETDVRGVVAKVIAGKTTREEKAAAIQQYLSREVRYTGVEFGDAAIIPHAPDETLKHKYGDCKDKATLEVAMLRSAGIQAYVALLNVGQRQDVAADLPGSGAFDHAVVYAPGTPDIWIDATDEYARLGQLPQADQGRKALIAGSESTNLVTIPEANSQENRIVEKREVYLAENGAARLVETTQPHGIHESEYRSAYADAQDKDIQKNLKDYIRNEYLSEKLTKTERSDPADLQKQFQLVLEASEAKRGFTDLDSAIVAIRLDSLFSGLPEVLQKREKTPEKGSEHAAEKPEKRRTRDYQLPRSFVREWQYEIVPPIGFQTKPLPPNTKISLGPAVLTEEFSKESDGSVHALVRLDTVKRRMGAGEAAELRSKVAELREGPAILIYFEPTTLALMSEGKLREAFQASRDLIKQHPNEAVYHLQRAKILLAAGLAQTGRDEARIAVKLEPGSALAEKTLAEMLEFDSVGRQYRRGSDYPGAEAAFRAAEKLDPTDNATVANLAILLERNSWGLRYGPGAKLKEAIAEYRKLGSGVLAELGLKNNLAFALFYDREFVEAKEISEASNPQPIGLIVACESAMKGAQAGLAEARKRTSGEEQFKQVASVAGQMLENLRIYPVAAHLMEAGATGANAADTAGDATLLRKAQLHEQISFPDDAAGAAMRFYVLYSGPNFTREQVRSLCSRNGKETIGSAEALEAMEKEANRAVNVKSREGLFSDVGVDLSVMRAQPKVEGDDATGYKVTLWSAANYRDYMFIVKEDGAYKVLATSWQPTGVGLEVLDRAAAGNSAGARALLDWLRMERRLGGGEDPLFGMPFMRMWSRGREASDTEIKLAAAAVLIERKQTAARGVAVLETETSSAKDDAEKLGVTLALLNGYFFVGEHEKMLAICDELTKRYPESHVAFISLTIQLRVLGRSNESDQAAEERLRRMPEDLDAMRVLSWDATDRQEYAKAHAIDQQTLDGGRAEPNDLNDIAWHALFVGKVENSDVEDVLKGVQLSNSNPSTMHTLGCVYAEIGKTKEAREVLVQAMDSLNLVEPDDNYWYAFGRIAEQYGEYESAKSDYGRVTKPKQPLDFYTSAYWLAQMRLKVMANTMTSVSDGKR